MICEKCNEFNGYKLTNKGLERMKTTLKKIELVSFKGVTTTLEFDDYCTFAGENATGKTTVIDAYHWLLFGKDAQDRTAFDIKTLTPDNKAIPKIEHSVTGYLDVDGFEVVLKRIYREKWTKVRGEPQPTMTGHEAEFEYNHVPKSATEYKSLIDEIIREDVFKLLTNPKYFNNLPWEKRRSILTEFAGEISDEEVGDKYGELIKILKDEKKDIMDYKKELEAKMKLIKSALQEIPVRIDETTRSMPEEPDYEKLELELAGVENKIKEIKSQIIDKSKITAKALENKNKVEKQKFDIRTRMQEIEFALQTEINTEQSLSRTTTSGYENRRKELESDIVSIATRLSNTILKISSLEKVISTLRKEWADINKSTLEFDEDLFMCPTCKREYDSSDIDAMKAEMTENFNKDKVSRLGTKSGEGTSKSQELKRYQLEKTEDEKLLKTKENELGTMQKQPTPKQVVGIEERLTNNEEYQLLQRQLTKIAEPEVVKTEVSDLNHAQDMAELDRAELLARLAIREHVSQKRSRIKELKDDEKIKSGVLSEHERMEYLINGFVMDKMNLVEDRVNKYFKTVKIKMFNLLINGGLDPTCTCLIDGVPYSSANNAGQINAGLEIISVLSMFYKVQTTCMIDNAEAVVDLYRIPAQMIRFVVSEKHKKLTKI